MEDVLAIANQEGAQTFIPVGFSMGGKLACLLTAKFPKRVSAQILVAPVAPGAVPIERELGLQICRNSKDWTPAKEFFLSWFGPGADQEIVNACCQTIAKTQQSALVATAEMILWTSLTVEIGKLKLPALLVVGENDAVYGLSYQQREMAPFLGQSQTEIVPCGHFIPLENPNELAILISRFVAKRD